MSGKGDKMTSGEGTSMTGNGGAASGQLLLPLDPLALSRGDEPVIGNQPLLMLFKFFALSSSEGEFEQEVPSPCGEGMIVKIRTEASGKYGVATQFDKNFFMYVVSKMASMKENGEVPRRVDITMAEFVKASGSKRCGHFYAQVRNALNRLQTTRVFTNIEQLSGSGTEEWFNWISWVRINYVRDKFGSGEQKMTSVSVEPASWVKDALDRDSTLIGYDRAYFHIKSPILQRVYEVINTDRSALIFKIKLSKLLSLTGWPGDTKAFKKNLKRILDVDDATEMPRKQIPAHSIYLYSDLSPEQSCGWSHRCPMDSQYFVFARKDRQQDTCTIDLNDIPEWETQMTASEIRALTTIRPEEGVLM